MNPSSLPLLMLLAAPAGAVDLSAAVEAAVARSPALAETRARGAQADAAGREAYWSRWPRLGAHASFVRGDDPLFAFGALLQQRRVAAPDFAPGTLNRPGYRTAVNGSLELGVPLFTGFELTRASNLAALAAQEAAAGGEAAAQAVRLRTVDAYLRVLRARTLLNELDARLTSAGAAIGTAESLKKRGLVLGSDHQAALALLSGLRAWRARVAAEGEAGGAELGVLLGTAEPLVSGDLREWSAPASDDATAPRGPEVRAAGLRADAAAVRREGAARALLPTVDAFAALNHAADGANAGASSRLLGVRASVLFGDPAYGSRRARAEADEAAAVAARAGAEDAARAQVRLRAAGLKGVSAALPELREALARAREALERVRPLYREGRQSVLEVLRAEEAVLRLEDARLDAEYQQRAQWAALRAAQGRLDTDAIRELASGLEASR